MDPERRLRQEPKATEEGNTRAPPKSDQPKIS